MNLRRNLFALSVVFSAAVTAAACSSSSSTPSGGNDASTGGTAAACTTLAACCGTGGMPAATTTQCSGVATAGNATNCAATYSAAQTAGYCKTATTGSGTGTTGTGTGTGTGNPGTGTGTGHPGTGTGTGTTGSGTGTTGGTTCANPPTTAPVGFTPPTGIIGSGCTSAETTALGGCAVATTDAGQNACDTTLTAGAATDGGANACGNCYLTFLIPGQPFPAKWGYELILGVEATAGDPTSAYEVNAGPNAGGCVMAADPAKGTACGMDLMALNACEFAVCLPLCAIPQSSTDFSSLQNCTSAVDTGACASYLAKAKADCAGESTATGTGPYDKCIALINQDINQGDAAPTATSESALIGLLCGGADAGF